MDFDFFGDMELNGFALVMGAVGSLAMLLIMTYATSKSELPVIWTIFGVILGFFAGYFYIVLTDK